MKFQIKNILAVVAISVVLFSCTNNDDEAITGEGSLKVEFDNIYKTADFAANTNYTNSNGEIVSVSKVKYIVSNIVLTKADGTTFTYPKSQSYFILDELTPSTLVLNLSGIPAGNYTKIKYGIGVDKAQWEAGATGQGDFLTTAQAAEMMWSWSAGYKFVAFEGTFTSATVTAATQFKVHTGQTGTDYNYAEVALDLPVDALVRTTITPQIHIMADLSQIVDGTNTINLSEGATIMGGAKLALVTANIANMFEVEHVHND
nr:MbnP family protein [uncultured Flavobacterium sp.]